MNSEDISIINKLLSSPKKIVVIGHKNPDGDAIGSSLGLCNFLKQKGHQVQVVMPNDFPEFLKWIPEASTIINYEQNFEDTKTAIEQAEIIFTLDFNALNRTGNLATELERATADFILIDHHQQPDDYAIVTYSDVAMCSTSEMIFHFMEKLKGIQLLNKKIATQLYVGIMTDTGSFRHNSTSKRIHEILKRMSGTLGEFG